MRTEQNKKDKKNKTKRNERYQKTGIKAKVATRVTAHIQS